MKSLNLSLRSDRTKEVAGRRWSSSLQRLCRRGVSYRGLLVWTSQRERDMTLAPQRRCLPGHHLLTKGESWRSGGVIAEPGRTFRVGIDPVRTISIPMLRLNCSSSGALRALASLLVCWYVCLLDKTWLPSVLL